jgi:putrescine aminotransferase
VIGEPERKVIIGRNNGYHGSTMAGASLGGMTWMHEQGDLPIPGITHIRQPYWYGEGGDLSVEEFGLAAARALEEKILEIGPERVAAFIAEPVQGSGGVIVPPESYWPEIQRIVDQHGILLVADEVICGFGRTGEWFGSDYYGIRPDLMSVAKGLSSGYVPIGGVLIADRVAEPLIERGGEFHHGFTYSGHPVRAVGDTMIVAPPLIISPEQLEELALSARRCLDLTWSELRSRGLI